MDSVVFCRYDLLTILWNWKKSIKCMFCVFLMITGPVFNHQVLRGQSVDGSYYRTNCLESLVEKIKKKRPVSRAHSIKLHFDNVSPHMTSTINHYLAKQSIIVMAHPVYSPDLALSDFWRFGFLKQWLEGYLDKKSLKRAVTQDP